jgi:hypothetical protein
MKSIKQIILAFLLLNASFSFAQSVPQGFNYQAVARDANGNAKTNQNFGVRLTIRKTSTNGTIVWQEIHSTVTTNGMGQFNLVVGSGVRQGSSTVVLFKDINWNNDSYFLESEIQQGIAPYTSIANTQLLSVPYSIASSRSDTANVAKFSEWSDYAIYEERYPSGTDLASVVGWNQRMINSTQSSNGTNISRTGSSFTLMPGTYYIKGEAFARYTNNNKLTLKDLANNIILTSIGGVANSNYGVSNILPIEGVVVVTVQTTYILDHYIQSAMATGLGYGSGLPSIDEVYSRIFIQKIK